MKKKTFRKIKRGFFIIICVLFVFGIWYAVFKTTFIRISAFEFIGVDDKYKTALTDELNKDTQQKFLYFIPTNNLLTYRSNVLKKSVTDILTNTKVVGIHPSGLHTLKISVTQYTPAFKLDYNNKVISNEGIEYTELNDVSNLPLLVEATPFDSASTTPIKLFITKINSVLFNVDKVVVDKYTDIHLVNTPKQSEVFFKSKDDTEKLWNTLISAVDTNPLKNNLQDSHQKLLYIDLRYGNKVFYKFTKIGTKDIIATSTINYATSTQTTSTGILAEPHR